MQMTTTVLARTGLAAMAVTIGATALALGGPGSVHSRSAVARQAALERACVAEMGGEGGCLHTPHLACCSLPGAPPRFRAAIEQYMWKTWFQTHKDMGGVAYFLAQRWTPGAQGDPITLRWSVVPDGLFIPSGIGEPGGASILRNRLIQIFGTLDAGLQRIRAVFAAWQATTGITFVEVSDDGAFWGAGGSASRGDIRIGMHNFVFGTVLAYSGFPNDGDCVMNGSVDFDVPANNFRFFRNTLAHEHGHGTGLFHSCPENQSKLMEPNLSTAFDGPQHDDIRGNQRHYGDMEEPNNGIGQAVDLGTQTIADVNGISIDDDADVDYFKFTVNQSNMMVTLRALPQGSIYPLAPQSADQTCPNGTDYNSIAVLNLTLRLLDSGLVTLVDDDSSIIGFTESLLDYHLPGPGTYYVRVGTSSAANEVQMYNFQLRVNPVPVSCPADLSGDHLVNGVDLAGLLAQWTGAATYSPCPPFRTGDLNHDCRVDGLDLGSMLAVWGACP